MKKAGLLSILFVVVLLDAAVMPWGIPSMFKARKDSLEPKQYSHNAHHNEAPLASKMLLSLYYCGL